MKEGDKVKIKKTSFPYQYSLRYIITQVNKTTVHCYLISNPKEIYKGVLKNILEVVEE